MTGKGPPLWKLDRKEAQTPLPGPVHPRRMKRMTGQGPVLQKLKKKDFLAPPLSSAPKVDEEG